MEGANENGNIREGNSIENTRSVTCPVCGRSFASYSGRRVHEKHAHPADYANEELELHKNKSKRLWTENEMYLLAQRDAALENMGLINGDRITILVDEFKRSADSLRKRRNLPEYKALVKAALERLHNLPDVQEEQVRVELHTTPIMQEEEVRVELHTTPIVQEEEVRVESHTTPMVPCNGTQCECQYCKYCCT